MANPGGGVGPKFVSVNLNKSYGQSSHHNHQHYSGSYGQAAAGGRARLGSGGGGGGMVVLSKSRSSQKAAGPKLSVPPPLNLPSLRKEHERFDLSGSGGGTATGAGPGSGPRPTSSGMSWTKPVSIALQEKDVGDGDPQVELTGHGGNGENRVSSAYMPPSARSGGIEVATSSVGSGGTFPKPVAKAVVLRGEDFPSLHAALPVSTGAGQKQKDNVNQKQKLVASEESTDQQRASFLPNSLVDMRPQGQALHHTSGNVTTENGDKGRGFGSSYLADQSQKQEYCPGPLPLVRLNPRSDWADDERDTGHGITERSRDLGFSKTESYWDRDYDMPMASVLPHKPMHNQYERWGLQDDETGRNFSSDVSKVDPYRREIRTPSSEGREGSTWRSSYLPKDGLNAQEAANDRDSFVARTTGFNKDLGKENKYMPPHIGDPAQDGVPTSQVTAYGRRNAGHFLEGRPRWNNVKESFHSRGSEWNTWELKYRGDGFQNSNTSKSLYTPGGKMPAGTDSLLTPAREKRASLKTERLYFEEPFMSSVGFDERDPFSGSLVGVIKRKKDVVKQTDMHDPVRESFEAELERVQKMQELERQRIIEEQERALEQVRREEEERQRLIREEEDRQRRLEEEAREAAWRAEQERLEAIQRTEEQKIARNEEKRRILLEEERRKEAAKQKLLELEQRMAKMQAEAVKSDSSVATANTNEKLPAIVKEKDVSTSANLGTWEDSEKMFKSITASVSFDSSVLNRPFEIISRQYPTRDRSSGFLEREKPFNSWRREVFENGNTAFSQLQENEISHLSPRRGSFANSRAVSRKELHGGAEYIPSRTYLGGMQEPYADEFGHEKEERWNFSGDADSSVRSSEMNSDFQDNLAEKYSDVGWAQNHFRGNTHSTYLERPYLHSESSELYSYGRSRYPVRQPRVLPPPIASTQRNSFRGVNKHPGRSGFPDDNSYSHAERSETTMQTGYYASHQDGVQQSELDILKEDNTPEDQKLKKDMTPMCDSQSSVSVSSPPNSPPHLSHDELDYSGDSPMVSTTAEGNHISFSGNESLSLNDNSEQHPRMTTSCSVSAIKDEDWTLENNDDLQQQEEYDEDEDGYQGEDEVREGDDENLDLNEEFEDLHLEERVSSHLMDNLVLGFNEGIEVEIPNDNFDRNFSNEERGFGIPDSSIHIVGEEELVNGIKGDEQNHEEINCFSTVATKVQETENTMQDSVFKPIEDACTSITPDTTILAAQQAVSASLDMPSSAGLTMAPTASSSPSQVDTSVKLQFGLFSGPSFVPSPVPAIQIGSIQMPLHLHPPIGASLAHMHPSQPPVFQFGELRYASPISQGVLPIAPQSLSSVQQNVQISHSLNQNAGGSLAIQPAPDDSTPNVMKDDVPSLGMNKKPGFVSGPINLNHGNSSPGLSSALVRQTTDKSARTQVTNAKVLGGRDDKLKLESVGQAENRRHDNAVAKNRIPSSGGTISEGLLQLMQPSNESVSNEKNFGGTKAQGGVSGSKGRRFTYAVRKSSMRSSFPVTDISSSDSNDFQRRSRTVHRTEFRVRENVERRQPTDSFSSSSLNLDHKPNHNGRSNAYNARSGSKRGTLSSKPLKQIANFESSMSSNFISHNVEFGNLVAKESERDVSMSDQNLSQSGVANLERNISEEDVDAPLQSGVVRVFKQPGIEAPSDEDDFIEVRSKRQMLNDRREQREKENKAKSRPPHKHRATRQTIVTPVRSTNSKKVSRSLAGASSPRINSDFASSKGQILVYKEASAPLVSQPLAPIGTLAVKSERQADKRSQKAKHHQTSFVSIVSVAGKDLGTASMFESKNKVIDNVQSSLSSWDTARINQQVMALTRTQLEEAMKPPRFGTPVASAGGHSSSVSDPLLASSSMLTKERSFSSAASPVDSLLAGEKIQFGAVTSPPILPPSSRAPGSGRQDIQISHTLSVPEDDCTLFFNKGQTDDSCVHLEDSEAEAEAAASAVAVAAISNDEVVGNGLGSAAISDSKSFGGADSDGISTGTACDQQLVVRSRGEESLSVSLPADLSVETPPISLWPPLPSPQNSSSHMLSHFPGGLPSHFPFYEMNPMLGGPIFAFGPHEESASAQSQPQNSSTTSSSGPLGTWQQCHATVDSFYGPPAGYPGPFVSPPGGIPGVQGPPHMVVYNHFAPVGQFGPVGLSFMGPTYIASGKHPDWKHNSSSSAVVMAESNMNNANIAAGQRNPPNMIRPIQHLASGSPLMPMASPLAMLDASGVQLNFLQSASDIPVQARWSRVPASPLHSVPLSRPLQQAEGVLPSQFGHTHSIDQSPNISRFSESQTSTPSTSDPGFTGATEVNAAQFPDELVLVDLSRPTTAGASTPNAVGQSSSTSATADVGNTENLRTSGSNRSEGHSTSGFKSRSFQQKNLLAQQSHSASYNYQRRMGLHGRNQSLGSDKGFPSSKMKQIYVVKQTTSGTQTPA